MSDTPTMRHIPPAQFGPTLRAARLRARLGLRAVAAACGSSYGYLGMLERGERSPSTVMAEDLIRVLKLTGADAQIVRDSAVALVGRDAVRR
ncbi:helix-turn-helix transcriptional regulator [Micromonospora sp. 4G57]|uniref:Helix-turn-helix transcriptional regulator n=1 Tax=Micromonospora sicca TaxID=2202420 RepID=A0ABU5JAV9_9ACTN|nr:MULTISPECIES: helix-turn-helix transcriptional regulator [unclassified Micromonospora]MDZ5443799.1 helix-turn-helix transcriptional regulator [Micromonospora sp. 4G57]MDZ5489683.1 helix-turn-helix transcriptional regulator [Micromonospora sp. 4G53]